MKRLAPLVLLTFALSGCFGQSEGTGTRNDPLRGKTAGRFCSTVGAYAYDKDNALLQCQRKVSDAAPRWTHVGD